MVTRSRSREERAAEWFMGAPPTPGELEQRGGSISRVTVGGYVLSHRILRGSTPTHVTKRIVQE
jgi:hypothetical protein